MKVMMAHFVGVFGLAATFAAGNVHAQYREQPVGWQGQEVVDIPQSLPPAQTVAYGDPQQVPNPRSVVPQIRAPGQTPTLAPPQSQAVPSLSPPPPEYGPGAPIVPETVTPSYQQPPRVIPTMPTSPAMPVMPTVPSYGPYPSQRGNSYYSNGNSCSTPSPATYGNSASCCEPATGEGRKRQWFSDGGDDCPRIGMVLWSGYDSWRGVSEAGTQNNNGSSSGMNVGGPVPFLEEYGIGAQIGGSYGTYDYMGRTLEETNRVQQQFFVTTGLFRRADEELPISASFAYDFMINDNFGTYADEPFLGQWRAQAGLALNENNEIGIWGTWVGRTDTSNPAAFGPTTYRPVSHIDLYLHHKFACLGADTWAWVGIPDRARGNGNGSLGEFIVGTAATVPLNDCMGLYFNMAYMKPSASMSPAGASEEGFNLSAGFAFYPGRTARSPHVGGHKWMPLLPVANNGSFWVDRY